MWLLAIQVTLKTPLVKKSPKEEINKGHPNNAGARRKQHRADGRSFQVVQISKVKLQRPLARAIEQALIVKYGLGKHSGQIENKINSIGELRDWYDEALEWGNKWIKNNDIPGL